MAITKGILKKGTLVAGLGKASRVVSDIPNNRLPEVVLNKTLEGTMRDFIRITQEKLERSAWMLDVRQEGDLLDSFSRRITMRSGLVSGEIRFNFYGRFVDMGVGNGVTLIEKQTGRALTNNRNPSRIARKAKPWFSPVWIREREKLSGVIARDIAQATSENLTELLPQGTLEVKI